MKIEEQEELEQAVNREFNKRTEKTTEADGKEALENKAKIESIVSKSKTLLKFIDDVSVFFALLKDYFSGNYKGVPWKTVAAIIAALLYVLTPLDVIPDFIPFLGLIDDAVVLTLCLKLVKSDVDTYAKWREEHNGTIDV